MLFPCINCDKRTESKGVKLVTTKNNRTQARSTCVECGHTKCPFVKKDLMIEEEVDDVPVVGKKVKAAKAKAPKVSPERVEGPSRSAAERAKRVSVGKKEKVLEVEPEPEPEDE